jgi:hypothetical protein
MRNTGFEGVREAGDRAVVLAAIIDDKAGRHLTRSRSAWRPGSATELFCDDCRRQNWLCFAEITDASALNGPDVRGCEQARRAGGSPDTVRANRTRRQNSGNAGLDGSPRWLAPLGTPIFKKST